MKKMQKDLLIILWLVTVVLAVIYLFVGQGVLPLVALVVALTGTAVFKVASERIISEDDTEKA